MSRNFWTVEIAAQTGGTMQSGLGRFASRGLVARGSRGWMQRSLASIWMEATKAQQIFHSRKSHFCLLFGATAKK
ncbi:hypothetical protein [Olivibacter sitiensis]|uniref:hypothetical protein n=1 Tax=Olivibacter sitiensis TaxID=376470 RepID=UPI000485581C|nr:hypothetical protein [Olivibacter sitiensis]